MTIPLSLLIFHTVGDFFLQSDWMAINKSKRLDALLLHVAIYSLCFLPWGLTFVGITVLTHLVTDFFTSKLSRRLFPLVKNDHPSGKFYYDYEGVGGRSRHWFFACIGIDQLIHFLTLAWTYHLIYG